MPLTAARDELKKNPPQANALLYLDLQDLQVYLERVADADARHQLARIALAAAKFRAEKGTLPATLAELAPTYLEKIPSDPITQRPFKFENKKDRIVIASSQSLKEGRTTWLQSQMYYEYSECFTLPKIELLK